MNKTTELKKIMAVLLLHPVCKGAAKQFQEVETRLKILSKEYEKPMKELWSEYNKMRTVSIYPFNVTLNDIERKLNTEQRKDLGL